MSGKYTIEGRAEDGSLIAYRIDDSENEMIAPTQWKIATHNSSEYGTTLLNNIIGRGRFSFPKSLYATRDTIKFFVANKPDALIVDFFAGSGTTLHATMLLNHLDGGHRRCIAVTNNEVSAEEQKKFIKQGLRPGDDEWEKYKNCKFMVTTSFYPNPEVEPLTTQMAIAYGRAVADSAVAAK
jgi:adenine-specific DNA-methyltransferase